MSDAELRTLLRRARLGEPDAAAATLGTLLRHGTLRAGSRTADDVRLATAEEAATLELASWGALEGDDAVPVALVASGAAAACAARTAPRHLEVQELARALSTADPADALATRSLLTCMYRHGQDLAMSQAAEAVCRAVCVHTLAGHPTASERAVLLQGAIDAHRQAMAARGWHGETLVPSALPKLATYLREGPGGPSPTMPDHLVSCICAAAREAGLVATRTALGLALATWAVEVTESAGAPRRSPARTAAPLRGTRGSR